MQPLWNQRSDRIFLLKAAIAERIAMVRQARGLMQ
jgi:hypothetical protein